MVKNNNEINSIEQTKININLFHWDKINRTTLNRNFKYNVFDVSRTNVE